MIKKGECTICEPSHSIVQFDEQKHDKDDDDSHSGSAQSHRLSFGLGKIMDWGKKVLHWFHFSKLGRGHSESLQNMVGGQFIIPDYTAYEAHWWNRAFKLDGSFKGPKYEEVEAFECAKVYANAVSIGNLSTLRRFLEVSLQKTDRAFYYFDRFRKMLTEKGRAEYEKRLKQAGCQGVVHSWCNQVVEITRATKIMLGLTRKRGLLVPEWADDVKLWVPPARQIIVTG